MKRDCTACQACRTYNLAEQWDVNLIHDLMAAGVHDILLNRVAALVATRPR